MVNEVQTRAELCDVLIAQYRKARLAVRERLGGSAVVGRRRAGVGRGGGEARAAWRGRGLREVAGPARSAAVVAPKNQHNRDDDGQNRENQPAAPRASAAVIGTIGGAFRTGTAPRFDLAPVRVVRASTFCL